MITPSAPVHAENCSGLREAWNLSPFPFSTTPHVHSRLLRPKPCSTLTPQAGSRSEKVQRCRTHQCMECTPCARPTLRRRAGDTAVRSGSAPARPRRAPALRMLRQRAASKAQPSLT